MSVYLNDQKYTGAYINGHRVNGYFNGIKLFNYITNIKVKFSNGATQQLYNVPIGNHTLVDLEQHYNLRYPQNYSANPNEPFNIQENSAITVDLDLKKTNITIEFSTGSNQVLYNVPFGIHTISDLENNYGLTIPNGYSAESANYNINSDNNSFNINLIPNSYTAYITFIDTHNDYESVGSMTATVIYGQYYSADDLAELSIPNQYNEDQGSNNSQEQECTGDMNLEFYVYPTPSEPPTPSTTTVQVNFICNGNVVGTHTYSGQPGTSGYAGFDVPSGYSLSSESFANFTYGTTNQYGYNVYVQANAQPSPYMPPASSASYTPYVPPQSSSASMDMPPAETTISRPIQWEAHGLGPVSSSDGSGSNYISAPLNTVGTLTDLSNMGITVTPPDGMTIHNNGGQIHFYNSDDGSPVIIWVSLN